MLKTIKAAETLLGMYIQSFDGNWTTHPFWRAHFKISSEYDLLRIRNSDVGVTIDTAKGRDVINPQEVKAPVVTQRLASARFGRADKARAADLAQRSSSVVKVLFEDCRLGKALDTVAILSAVDDIADALAHDLSAFITLTRLKAKDDYTYTHSVAVCALMISLAREMGETPAVVRELGMAGLLHDIGKVNVPDDILQKTEALTETEMEKIRQHPVCGYKMLRQSCGVPPLVLDVCLHHHERPDGAGYPYGLAGDAVSYAARVASVCDVYEAMTSVRCYKRGMTPLEAISAMDASKGQFDGGILFRFMREIGVYPAGKLVRLQCNRLAVTLPGHRNGLGPVFRAFYSTTDTRFIRYEDVILSDHRSSDDTVGAEDPAAWFSTDWSILAARILAGEEIDQYRR